MIYKLHKVFKKALFLNEIRLLIGWVIHPKLDVYNNF